MSSLKDIAKNGKTLDFKFNPFAKKEPEDLPNRPSDDKLAYENVAGLCDAEKLPRGTVPLRSPYIFGVGTFERYDDQEVTFESRAPAKFQYCEGRYLDLAKFPGARPMTDDEWEACARAEYVAKEMEAGRDSSNYPADRFEREKITEEYKPKILARIAYLKRAKQFCVGTAHFTPTLYHYVPRLHATPIRFIGFAAGGAIGQRSADGLGWERDKSGGFGISQSEPSFLKVMSRIHNNKIEDANTSDLFHINFHASNADARALERADKPLTSVCYLTVHAHGKGVSGRTLGFQRSWDSLKTKVTYFEMTYEDGDGKIKKFVPTM